MALISNCLASLQNFTWTCITYVPQSIIWIFNQSVDRLSKLLQRSPSINLFRTSYMDSFKEFLEVNLISQKKVFSSELVKSAKEFNAAESANVKQTKYQLFLEKFRHELTFHPTLEIDRLAKALYEQDFLFPYQQLITEELKVSVLVQNLQARGLIDFIDKTRKKVSLSWSHLGARAEVLYDPRHDGDIPSFVYEMNIQGKKTNVIRTPNVTMDVFDPTRIVKSEIVPEFHGFLRQTDSHLYINLMITQDMCGEKRRSEKIHELAQIYSHVNVVSLDKDSWFYHQTHQFTTIDDAKMFKQIFFENMQKGLNFKFPQSFNIELEVPRVLNEVHQEFFESKDNLSKIERREFIELVNTRLIERLCEIYKPDSLNISCKSTVDRGAAQLAMLHAFHHRHNKSKIKPSLIAALAIGPALGNQNRAMLKDRYNMMKNVLARCL